MMTENEVHKLLLQAIQKREYLLDIGETTNKIDGIIYALTLVLQGD